MKLKLMLNWLSGRLQKNKSSELRIGILDHSEGPVSGSMKAEFKELIEQADAVDNKFDSDLEKELRKFEKLIK